MTESKQISIYQLLQFMTDGWVAMNGDKKWIWSALQPIPEHLSRRWGEWFPGNVVCLSDMFDIAPFDGYWSDSLIEVKGVGCAN